MKKTDTENSITTIITNPPTKDQADERIKKLSKHLEEVWNNLQNTR